MNPRPGGIFYGWYVVVAIGVVMTTVSGLAFYNLSVLLDAFVTQRGFPVGLASGATAVYFLAAGAGGMFAARMMERIDPRFIMIGGACAISALFVGIGFIWRPVELYVFHVLFGFGYGCCGLVPATTIVARWFDVHRPLAISVASTGLSLGGIVLTPVAAFLIGRSGLDGAAPWLALGFFLGVVPATAWLVRSSPYELGFEPDGHPKPARPAKAISAPSIPFDQARRSRFFIGLNVAYIFTLGAQVGAIAHLFRLVNTREDAATAALAVSVLAAASVVGRLAGGWLLLKMPSRTFAAAIFAIQIVSLVVLALAPSRSALLPGAVLFGLSVGNILMLQSLLLVEAFGIRDYGRIYSLSQLLTAIGLAGGPVLMGFINQIAGSYTVPYLVVAAGSATGLVALMFAGPVRRAL